MDEHIVFAIETAASTEANLLRVDDHTGTLAVVDIVIYAHHVAELNRMLTGTLYLRDACPAGELSGSYLFDADNQ